MLTFRGTMNYVSRLGMVRVPLRKQSSSIHTVVMLRHGESLWNVENRFTGWCDVPLTEHGEADAIDAGHLMGDRGLKFDVAFTSNLERAWRTCALTLAAAGQSGVETIRSSMLNERHYGALQGHKKDCPDLLKTFGEDKVLEWRRSYSTAPPSLYDADFLHKFGPSGLLTSTSELNEKYIDSQRLDDALHVFPNAPSVRSSVFTANASLERSVAPTTESLQQCEQRAYGYWQQVIAPRVAAGERVLIVAHANTIRALVKAVDGIDDQKIAHLKIPNGIPLVYTMDENLRPSNVVTTDNDIGFQARYLVSARNHSKMMSYERCVQKKLRALFEYLDVDGDGIITQNCLLSGLARLHSGGALRCLSSELGNEEPGTMGMDPGVCEYSVEELIRSVPNADRQSGISLQAFLDAEATLLPRLTNLKLLQ